MDGASFGTSGSVDVVSDVVHGPFQVGGRSSCHVGPRFCLCEYLENQNLNKSGIVRWILQDVVLVSGTYSRCKNLHAEPLQCFVDIDIRTRTRGM